MSVLYQQRVDLINMMIENPPKTQEGLDVAMAAYEMSALEIMGAIFNGASLEEVKEARMLLCRLLTALEPLIAACGEYQEVPSLGQLITNEAGTKGVLVEVVREQPVLANWMPGNDTFH